MVHKLIGNWLWMKRKQAGLTQAALAARIGQCPSFVGQYERGRRLELIRALKVCHVLGVDPRELVGLVEQSCRRNGGR